MHGSYHWFTVPPCTPLRAAQSSTRPLHGARVAPRQTDSPDSGRNRRVGRILRAEGGLEGAKADPEVIWLQARGRVRHAAAHGGGGNLTLVVLLQQLCKILVMLLHQHRANVDGGGVGRCVLGAGAGGRAGRVCGAVGGRAGTRRGRT